MLSIPLSLDTDMSSMDEDEPFQHENHGMSEPYSSLPSLFATEVLSHLFQER
jgi:hypothetical protein